MVQENLALLSASELSALYRSRKASPVEATRAVLAQIECAQSGSQRVLLARCGRGAGVRARERRPVAAG